jgi:type II secretory pathway component PulK
VNALPRGAKININTAPKAVLKALVDYVGVQDAEKVINEFDEKRKDQPQKDVNEFMKPIEDYVESLKPPPGNAGAQSNTPENEKYKIAKQSKDRLKADMIDVKSEYFYLTAQSQIGDMNIVLISLLHRKDDKVKTLRRGLGVI